MSFRVGQGYDLHQMTQGRALILGGVTIPYEKGLLGHSDADVLIHAVIDALLGAAALGDIGKHFPDTDPVYKGADSMELLRNTAAKLASVGYTVENIDTTIVCQKPKLAPHITAMRKNLADALGISIDQVSVKAKSNEEVDAVGKGEAVIAYAAALIRS